MPAHIPFPYARPDFLDSSGDLLGASVSLCLYMRDRALCLDISLSLSGFAFSKKGKDIEREGEQRALSLSLYELWFFRLLFGFRLQR